MSEKKRSIKTLTNTSSKYLSNFLDQNDVLQFKKLIPELKDTWSKKQMFRTETEMRFSVLNDNRFPTKASKYWQSVREQNTHFENLMQLSFEYRKNDIEIEKLQTKIKAEKDIYEKKLMQVELEEKQFQKASMELMGKHRMREVSTWSKLKKELDDGSFDKKDVNVHQAESYRQRLTLQANAITPNTSYQEAENVLGQLNTLNRIIKKGELKITNQKKLSKK